MEKVTKARLKECKGTWLAQWVERATLHLEVMSWSPTLNAKITLKKKKTTMQGMVRWSPVDEHLWGNEPSLEKEVTSAEVFEGVVATAGGRGNELEGKGRY